MTPYFVNKMIIVGSLHITNSESGYSDATEVNVMEFVAEEGEGGG